MGNGTSKFNPANDLGDLNGKVAIVTGGNRGIGFHTARYLAKQGAKVYLGARNGDAAKAAIEEITKLNGEGGGEVVWLELDLSRPILVKQAAEAFLSKETRLDILVNNAGGMPGYEMTEDGISQITAVNYLGPFVLTRILTPLLIETAKLPDSDLASEAHQVTPSAATIRFQTKEDLSPDYSRRRPVPNFFLYGHSKFCSISWTHILQRHFDTFDVPIICISVHPGFVDTFTQKLPFPSITSPALRWMMYTPEEGAYTSLFAAASPVIRAEKDRFKGAYVKPFGVVIEPLKQTKNAEIGEELVAFTEEFLREVGVDVTATD
ncbi:hypothetical protein ONZ45_g14808 [Pleurotus djamor]|nr:hypothetical protein ONZ45_g14808 [Pleurotus djamor]